MPLESAQSTPPAPTADKKQLGRFEITALEPQFVRGALFIIAAEFMFVCMGAGIRVASAELSNAEIVFYRNLLAVFFLAPLLLRGGLDSFRTHVPKLHLFRGLAGVSAMYCFFYAIANMPLADAMLLKLTSPLFIPLVALFMLAEPVPAAVRWALLIGFAGVSLILQPDFDGISTVALIALLGGVFAAIAKVTVRRLSRTEPASRIVFYFAVTGTVVSVIPLFWYWQVPSPDILPWVLALGVFATIGQLLLTRGFASAPAGRMGAFGFFSVVFGAAFGWLFWDEVLRWTTVAGTLLILIAGVAVSRNSPSKA